MVGMEDKLLLMKEKIKLLNEANKAYYQEDREIMSNYEYDKLYDELKKMEEETGVVLSNSPTLKVGYELLSNLPKERHEKAMLSLDKTKEVSALKDWLGEKTGVLSWKLDGLTIVMTYEGGRLTKAVTRGNGEVGEVVTNNAKVFTNIPLTIAYKGSLVLRGEAVISYSDFNKLNQLLPETEGKYKEEFKEIFKSITMDNGCEFLNQQLIERSLYSKEPRTMAYYAHPYSSWERGSNENANKIIRRFIPKGSDINKYTEEEIKRIENWINNYPRRILGYKSAKEMYKAA
jgi:hypothetical protein